MDNNKNWLLTFILAAIILIGWQHFYQAPHDALVRQAMLAAKATAAKSPATPALAPSAGGTSGVSAVAAELRDREVILKEEARVKIQTPELQGSIRLKGARLDDLTLVNYHEVADPASPRIVLLAPAGSAPPHNAYYVEFHWLGNKLVLPQEDTLWQADSTTLTPDHPVRLTWSNGQGLSFERKIAVDGRFMFTISDRVTNNSTSAVTLYPSGLIARHGKPPTSDTYVLHEGPLGVLDGTLREEKYKDLFKGGARQEKSFESEGGWLGITDKYWLTALIPAQDEKITAAFKYEPVEGAKPEQGVFQTDFRRSAVTLAAGATAESSVNFFGGAKRVRVLDAYADQYSIPHFDRAIDFGWYYFLTKPFLYLLDTLSQWLGNFGIAILMFTVLLRLATLPLSMRSYRSMAKIRLLQPEIKAIQERHAEDRVKQSVESMELYKREKVNPLSGCFITLFQIPIFFALYKVLYVGIEMRHAPFYGWIHDLSAPDPTSVLTLFGHIPQIVVPLFFIHPTLPPTLGVWPLLMGISMFMQQRLSPQPPDKTQAQMLLWLPVVFTFTLASVSVGLIIYWTWSNILGLAQQWFVYKQVGEKMKGHGTPAGR